MIDYKRKVVEAANFLKTKISENFQIGLITGTGLGECAEFMDISAAFDYSDIPNFPVSTVESHKGRLLFGSIKGRWIIAMQGRLHLYEGFSPLEVTFPIRVMQELGVKHLIISNAAGGLNRDFKTGDIMIIEDHINLTGFNPLVGLNESCWKPRFPDMIHAYDPGLQDVSQKTKETYKLPIQKGVYAGLLGPCLETPAEVRFLKKIGADAVGFSTVQEVIVAVQAGMKVIGLSTITNIHNPDDPVTSVIEDIIDIANQAAPALEKIITEVVQTIKE